MNFIRFYAQKFSSKNTIFYFHFFFFNETATTEIYTLSLHDALPICPHWDQGTKEVLKYKDIIVAGPDRKSTRLNSSHLVISYAVFCLKKKTKTNARRRGRLARERMYARATEVV